MIHVSRELSHKNNERMTRISGLEADIKKLQRDLAKLELIHMETSAQIFAKEIELDELSDDL